MPNQKPRLKLRRGDFILCVLLSVALVISFTYSLSLWLQPASGVIALVEIGGLLQESIALDEVTVPWEKSYFSGGDNEAVNTIRVEPGRIRVIEANCPEQVDVRIGWLSRAGESAICLPHRFVLRLVAQGEADRYIDTVLP